MFVVAYSPDHANGNESEDYKSLHFAATRKDLPGLVERIAKQEDEGADDVLRHSWYAEINTGLAREGDLEVVNPLRDLLKIRVSLIPVEKKKEEKVIDEGNKD